MREWKKILKPDQINSAVGVLDQPPKAVFAPHPAYVRVTLGCVAIVAVCALTVTSAFQHIPTLAELTDTPTNLALVGIAALALAMGCSGVNRVRRSRKAVQHLFATARGAGNGSRAIAVYFEQMFEAHGLSVAYVDSAQKIRMVTALTSLDITAGPDTEHDQDKVHSAMELKLGAAWHELCAGLGISPPARSA